MKYFLESTDYEKKMIWLEGLANIQLGRVVEFLESIASGNNAESRDFRALAAWASLPSAPLRPDIVRSIKSYTYIHTYIFFFLLLKCSSSNILLYVLLFIDISCLLANVGK